MIESVSNEHFNVALYPFCNSPEKVSVPKIEKSKITNLGDTTNLSNTTNLGNITNLVPKTLI